MRTPASLCSQSINFLTEFFLQPFSSFSTRLLQGAYVLAPGSGEVFSPQGSLASQSGSTTFTRFIPRDGFICSIISALRYCKLCHWSKEFHSCLAVLPR